jgi:PKD repeat protein
VPHRVSFLHRLVLAAVALALGLAVSTCAREHPTEPLPSAPALTPAGSHRYVPGRLLVQFRQGVDPASVARVHGAAVRRRFAFGAHLLEVEPGRELAVAARLRARRDVVFAEPDWLRTLDDPSCSGCALPSDGLFGYKWDLHNDGTVNSSTGDVLATTGQADADIDWLEAHEALGSAFGGVARLAILDTGVRATHEDLAGRVVAQHDFVNDDPDASDDQGHGTHVAGIAAARGDNAKGLAGVAYGSGIGIMAAKVCTPTFFGLNAECPSSAIAAAITWAVDNGADVVNLSLGGDEASETERQAFQYARDRGVLAVCAAGNSGANQALYPAAFPECVAVTATDWGDALASYSNWGPEVLLAAPGGDTEDGNGYSQIASTCYGSDTSYCLKAGTSMATPQVAGLAALLYALEVGDDDAVLARLQATADDLGPSGWDDRFGHGRVNAHRAVAGLSGGGPANQAPTAEFAAGCSGSTCSFTDASSDPDGSIVTWAWTFGDGATAVVPNPTHVYACSGTYNVSLTVTDDHGAAASVAHQVVVSVEGGGGSDAIAVAGLVLRLEAHAVTGVAEGGEVASWPDGSGSCHHATQTVAGKRPVYRSVAAHGKPALSFDAADDGMTTDVDVGTATTIVTVYASRAGATGHVLNGGSRFFMGPYVGRYRNFTGAYATGPPVEAGRLVVQTLRQSAGRAELFLDGVFEKAASKTVDPLAVLLAREGTYGKILDGDVAEVLVWDRALSDAELGAVHDALLAEYPAPSGPNQPPTAAFSSSCTDLACAFSDASVDGDGTVASWSWSFGDGASSAERNPSHTYAAAGTYTVTLEVADDDGATASVAHDVTVTAPPVGGDEGPPSVPGLVLWLSADALPGLADGDPVSSWPDLSGAGSDATQPDAARRPTYRTGQVQGLPAVVFDATDDGMATSVDLGREVTVFLVYASRAAASGHVMNGGHRLFMGPYVGRYRNYTGAYATGPAVTAGRWLLQTLRQSTSLAELFVDGVFQASTTATADPTSLLLAAQGTYGRPLDGSLAEVVVYDRTLSDAERQSVESWLRAKYALP